MSLCCKSNNETNHMNWYCTYSAGGSKGPCRPLGGVRGVPAFLPHPAAAGGARERRPEELQNFLSSDKWQQVDEGENHHPYAVYQMPVHFTRLSRPTVLRCGIATRAS